MGVALLAASVLGACAASPRLLDERRAEPYARLLAKVDAARIDDERVRVSLPGGPSLTIGLRVVHAPRGASHPVLVLQPGVFSDGTTWRFLVGALAEENDLLIVDPPGCGTSDKPAPACLDPTGYSPAWLAECTLLAVRDWQARQPTPRRLALVGHSLGGTVVLRMMAAPDLTRRYADVVARVDRVVLLDPADLAMTQADPRLVELRDLPDWKASIAGTLGILRRNVRQAIHDAVVHPERDALCQEAERITAVLSDPATRHAGQAMLRRFQPTDATGCPDRAATARLADEERSIVVPLLVLWGERDDTVALANARPLLDRLRGERLVVIPAAKHSAHQEAVLDVARELTAFVNVPAVPRVQPARAVP